MTAWVNETVRLYIHLFGRDTARGTYAIVALCVLLGGLVLSRISTRLGAIGAFYLRGECLTGGGVALLLAAMPLPEVFGLTGWWLPLSAAALVLLLMVLPLTVVFLKGRYVSALIAWTVTLLTVGAVLALETATRRKVDAFMQRVERLDREPGRSP